MSTTAEIVKTPDVLHGQPRIEGTRIGVFVIGESIRADASDQTVETIRESYPDLSRDQIHAALAYYDDHPDEMDALRAEREAVIEQIDERRREHDREHGGNGERQQPSDA